MLKAWKAIAFAGILYAPSLWATCNASREYTYSGDKGSTFGESIRSGTRQPESGSCKFAHALCAFYIYTEDHLNPSNSGVGIQFAHIFNTEEGDGWYDGPSFSSDPSAGGVTFDDLRQREIEQINLENDEDESKTSTLEDMICYPDPIFLLEKPNAGAGDPKNECSASPMPGLESGSIIDSRTGDLAQEIPISGTPFLLHYTVANVVKPATYDIKVHVPGYKPYPDYYSQWNLSEIELTVQFDGYGISLTHSFMASSIDESEGADYTIAWDGKDSTGTFIPLPTNASVTAKYKFSTGWLSSPEELSRTFPLVVGSIDSTSKFKAGGWSISQYHYFDDKTKSVYLGTGQVIRNENSSPFLVPDTNGNIHVPNIDSTILYTFNSTGKHLSTSDALTGKTIYTFQYDVSDRLISITDRNGKVYDLAYNSNGQIESIANPYGRTTSLTYDLVGNLYQIQDPLGREHRFFYKNGQLNGPMTAYRNPMGKTKYYAYGADNSLQVATNAKGGEKSFTRTDTRSGNAAISTVFVTSPMGRQTTYESKSATDGQITFRNTNPTGYFEEQFIEEDGKKFTTSTSLSDSLVETFEQDSRFPGRKRMKSISTYGANSGQRDFQYSYQYSNPSDPLSLTKFTQLSSINSLNFKFESDRSLLKETNTNPSGMTFGKTFDSLGRLATEYYGSLNPVSYSYNSNGQLQSFTQGSRVFSFTYYSTGEMESYTDPLSNTYYYSYDAAGQMTSKTLPNGKSYSFDYDLNGNVTSISNGASNIYVYDFDDNENLTLQTDPIISAQSFVKEWDYNADDDPTSIVHEDSSVTDFTYNLDGSIASQTGTLYNRSFVWNDGKLEGINSTSNVNLEFDYDNRLKSSTWQGAVNGSVGLSWNGNEQLSEVVINGSVSVPFGYDDDFELSQVNDLTLTRYSTTGLLATTSEGQVDSTYSYNAYGEELSAGYSKTSGAVVSFSYTRDSLGRLDALSKTAGGVTTTTTYTYDSIGQLETETSGGITTPYTYSDNGNRYTATGSEIYDAQDRLVSNSDWNYTYSKNGHLTRKDHVSNGSYVTYTYDGLGNLLSVQFSGGAKVDYLVDGLDRRVRRRLNNTFSAAYIYLDQTRVAAQLNSNGTVKSTFVYGLKKHVPDLMIQNGVSYRIISDHLGSVLYVVRTTNGQIVQQLTYDTWGKVLSDSNPGFQPFGFAGGLYDSTTGLVRFGARDYDPSIGRWLNKDFARHDGGMNLYAYVENDPVNFIDRDGNQAMAPAMGGTIAGGLVLGALVFGPPPPVACPDFSTMNASKEDGGPKRKQGKQKDGTPKRNIDQNPVFEDAFKDFNKERRKQGKKELGKKERERIHRELRENKQKRGYHDLQDLMEEMYP